MRLLPVLALSLCGAVASFPVAAQSAAEPAAATVPKPLLDCSNAWRAAAKEVEEPETFRCTRTYYESLPGSNGSTYDMGRAAARAAEAGDLYIDSILTPEISQGLEPDPDRAGSRRLTRDFLLRGYLRSARAAGEALCDIYYDYHSEGTIRSVVAGSCAVSNRDRLIGELLTLAAMITAQEG